LRGQQYYDFVDDDFVYDCHASSTSLQGQQLLCRRLRQQHQYVCGYQQFYYYAHYGVLYDCVSSTTLRGQQYADFVYDCASTHDLRGQQYCDFVYYDCASNTSL
jgi:hypothetical protein